MTDPIFIHPTADVSPSATIGAGTHIWHQAKVGAGAVVTHDVPDYGLVYGNPARLRGFVCPCGEALTKAGERDSAVLMRCANGHDIVAIPREVYNGLHVLAKLI